MALRFDIHLHTSRYSGDSEIDPFKLASQLEMPCTASSDAHRLEDVGKYWTEFTVPVQTMKDFKSALKSGSFRPKTSSAS